MATPRPTPAAVATKRAALKAQGAAFQAARLAAGYSQSGAAEALGVPQDTLQNWERGRRSIPAELRRVAIEDWGADPTALADLCPHCGRPL